MKILEDRITRELRRQQLAVRLITHRARTQTICDFTGLTRERTKTLRREWNVPDQERHRGPSPTSLSVFFRSPRARSEASTLAVACRILRVVQKHPVGAAARYLRNLDYGERLCDVFEAYQTYFPASAITFEQVTLLATALAEGDVIQLVHCSNCGAMLLIDRLAADEDLCSHCVPERKKES